MVAPVNYISGTINIGSGFVRHKIYLVEIFYETAENMMTEGLSEMFSNKSFGPIGGYNFF